MDQLVIDTALERVRAALEAGKVDEALAVLANLHPADRAEAFSDLPRDEQEELFPRLDPEDAAELLEELEDDEAAEAAGSLPTGALADVLDEMEPDAAADILGDLPPEQAKAALAEMGAEQAEDVRPLLAHADDTAGGLMTPEFFALRRQMTARQAIEFLRGQALDRDAPYYLYVVDRDDHLIGVVGLRDLIVAAPEALIESIMRPDVRSVPVGTDQEDVAQLMKKYGWLALPVVDAQGRLVGVIKHNDIVYVIEEEATEDLYRLANVSDGDLSVWSPVRLSVSRRLPWLVVNLGTAFLAASVVSLFEATIAKVALLAVFQSIVAGQGGNAGTQTLAMMVRGIALGEIELRDVGSALLREVGIGLIHGAIIGVAVALGAWLWKGIPVLGLIIGLAMLGNMVAAGLAGTLVPLTLKAFKLDPALASAVLVTTVTDCVGFGLFLGLSTLFLPYLTV
ncbi:MAG: magnesium transporter [Anaerolineales bacterium]|nr:magnesium transporter [Anaerolineales bacterium]